MCDASEYSSFHRGLKTVMKMMKLKYLPLHLDLLVCLVDHELNACGKIKIKRINVIIIKEN